MPCPCAYQPSHQCVPLTHEETNSPQVPSTLQNRTNQPDITSDGLTDPPNPARLTIVIPRWGDENRPPGAHNAITKEVVCEGAANEAKSTFCPAELREAIIDMMEAHLCALIHACIPGHPRSQLSLPVLKSRIPCWQASHWLYKPIQFRLGPVVCLSCFESSASASAKPGLDSAGQLYEH
jgi:hypothetical protein